LRLVFGEENAVFQRLDVALDGVEKEEVIKL